MDGRPTWTDCDEAGDYVVPNVLSPRDLVFRPDNMDETVPHTNTLNGTVLSLFPDRQWTIYTKCPTVCEGYSWSFRNNYTHLLVLGSWSLFHNLIH